MKVGPWELMTCDPRRAKVNALRGMVSLAGTHLVCVVLVGADNTGEGGVTPGRDQAVMSGLGKGCSLREGTTFCLPLPPRCG
jgi:hypothetical protein